MKRPIIVKFGGSLLQQDNGDILRSLGSILTQAASPLLVIPGGGPFADTVRHYGKQLDLSEETCHFMALTAMDQYAFLLKEFMPGSEIIDLGNPFNPADTLNIPTTSANAKILLCSRFLRQLPSDDLLRSWDVTSDSIAAYLTRKINGAMLVILKSKDINPKLQEPDVDPFFCRLLPLRIPVWFLNGMHPQRLAELLQIGSTQGVYLAPGHTNAQFSV
ncbi:MAG: hypothetical protein APF84_02365 [Gracilibacter sp. BRH_c7a]|nr:MAG: hypothetical protein APF84_02365 [Gracilibacter sp. BRH_c7a]